MAIEQRHSPYGVLCDTTLIGGVTSQSVMTNTQVSGDTSAGRVFPAAAMMTAQNPTASFTTYDLKALLDLLSAGAMSWAISGNGFAVYGWKHAAGGLRASGSVHHRVLLSAGMVYAGTLRCSHQGHATLDALVAAIYDGVNEPLIPQTSVALPAGTLYDDRRWTLGPITLGGVTLTGFTDLSIDFGWQVDADSAESDIWPTHVSAIAGNPVITISGIQADWMKTAGSIPLTGSEATTLNTGIYLRKRDNAGRFVANGTSEHIALVCNGLITPEDALRAAQGGPAGATLRLTATSDSNNHPFSINTATTIT